MADEAKFSTGFDDASEAERQRLEDLLQSVDVTLWEAELEPFKFTFMSSNPIPSRTPPSRRDDSLR
jgi:hypothetical protein